uniref:Reverse transcriptase domain-containing protein n=1 Tax=Fundulus heteroclitus TaxID=8078 RepID=A0A3Q2PAQ2_FUNHE
MKIKLGRNCHGLVFGLAFFLFFSVPPLTQLTLQVLENGTPQGSVISPVASLFVIAIEPLAQKIRCHTAIHGINMGSIHHKLLLYADDMLVLLTKPEESVPVLLDCIEDFKLLSGYKVNCDKSEAMPVSGRCPSSLYKNWRFRWSPKSIKYLGIQITSDYNNMVKMNTAPVVFYLLCNIPLHIQYCFFKELNVLILGFLWGKSYHRLSLKKLQASVDRGGFSLPNFKWYFFAKQLRVWLPTFNSSSKPSWSQLESDTNGGESPWATLLGVKTRMHRDHRIITAAKLIWNKVHRAGRWDFIKSSLAPLWNNNKILIGGNWPQWFEVGISCERR